MRDNDYVIIGIVSAILMGLELIGIINEYFGFLGYLGMLMFLFNTITNIKQNSKLK